MKSSLIYIIIVCIFPSFVGVQAQITGTFTADNSYAVYIGNQSSVATKVLPTSGNGHSNTIASQIFSPTQNTFTANSSNYFYIIAWSDDKSCQGLLGEFTGDQTIMTGDSGWEVYPTNKNYGNGQAPSKNEINSYINTANSSNGWKAPFVGPTNLNGKKACSAYRKVNGISDKAKWIWYNSTSSTNPSHVFGQGKNHREFLIFRFPVKQITNGNGSSASIDKCDCIPEDLYSVDLTSEIFKVTNVSGPIGSFTYKLKFDPSLQYAGLSTAWNNWINAQFGLNGSNRCQVVHQYMLYSYTPNSSGGIGSESLLEQFWSSPAYFPYSQSNFNTTLNSNQKYYIKHGIYYGRKDGGKCLLAKDCPWSETRLFLEARTGDTPKIEILDEQRKVIRELQQNQKK